jgi:hypothetical protein
METKIQAILTTTLKTTNSTATSAITNETAEAKITIGNDRDTEGDSVILTVTIGGCSGMVVTLIYTLLKFLNKKQFFHPCIEFIGARLKLRVNVEVAQVTKIIKNF